MTSNPESNRLARMEQAQAKRARQHLYTWCAERGKYVIEAPAIQGGRVIAVLEATRNDPNVHQQASAMCRALDRVATSHDQESTP